MVDSEIQSLPVSSEDISLDLGTLNGNSHSFKFGYDYGNLDSPSECTTLSTISTSTATPLDQKHRYHLFFAYHNRDRIWVDHVVQRLEGEAHNFKCCFPERDFEDKVTQLQNILCSIMLSKRVIVVLTPHFIEEEWDAYEESISHLTSLTLRKHRVVPVLLEECEVPDSLRMLDIIDVRHGEFWDNIFVAINLGKSDSVLYFIFTSTLTSCLEHSLCFSYMLVSIRYTWKHLYGAHKISLRLNHYHITVIVKFHHSIGKYVQPNVNIFSKTKYNKKVK